MLNTAEKNNLELTDFEVARIAVELQKAANLNDIAGSLHEFTRRDGSFQEAIFHVGNKIEDQIFYDEIHGPLIELEKALHRIADKFND